MRRNVVLGRRAALGLAGGLVVRPARAGAPAQGGRMIYARHADSMLLDPVLCEAHVDIWILNALYDTLLLPTADGTSVQAGLATKWDLSDRGRTLTLTLRDGVQFSDGSALRPEDVTWSLDRARTPGNGRWWNLLASIAETGIDGGRVVLRLSRPDATLLPALATFNTSVLPRRLFEAAPGTTPDDKARAFAAKPVGTGPFLLSTWQRGASMLLKRNPHDWDRDSEGRTLPYLDELEFVVIPDDGARLAKLRDGGAHGAEFVPYARVKDLQAVPGLRMELWPSTRVRFLAMNVRPVMAGRPNPLSSLQIRQALNYAVDKDAVIAGRPGKPQRSFMSSATPLFYGPQPLYPYDPARARALLGEAGVGEGGLELSCLALAGNRDDADDLALVRRMWASVGVRLAVEAVDEAARAARTRAGSFHLHTVTWNNDIADPGEVTSYFAYSPTAHALQSGWRDARLDALFEASQQENDVEKRRAQYEQIQQIFAAAAVCVFLYEAPYPVAWQRNAQGFVQNPLGYNDFRGAWVEAG